MSEHELGIGETHGARNLSLIINRNASDPEQILSTQLVTIEDEAPLDLAHIAHNEG